MWLSYIQVLLGGLMEYRRIVFVFVLSILMAVTAAAQQATNESPSQHAARTRVVLLGTGTPVPDPDRSGRQPLSKSTDGTVSHWKYIIGNVIVYRHVYRASRSHEGLP